MSKARYLLERLDQIAEDEANAEVHIHPEDSILHNMTDKKFPIPCPTCGHSLHTAVMSPSVINCPKCMHNVDVYTGQEATNLGIRTLSGNSVSADGIKRSGLYD